MSDEPRNQNLDSPHPAPPAETPRLSVDVWSDIACPWCYVGKRRLEAALQAFPHRAHVDVVWRAFELDPSAPRERPAEGPYAERLAKKYGSSVPEAEGMITRMIGVARDEGLDFRFDKIRPGNTFDAHRLLHLAGERGLQDATKERFLLGYMTEGAPIGDPETLTRLASEAGLDADEIRATLATDAYAREVRAEEADAAELGIRGVPFFVIGRKYAVSGAQPREVLLGALTKAWEEVAQKPVMFGEGAVCGPDGCF
jgi:predicted DsbA family dithiol-disulfide isomerase